MKILPCDFLFILVVCVYSKKPNLGRIGQGHEVTDPTKFPFLAIVDIIDTTDAIPHMAIVTCGGTLIHKQWILTAGSCFGDAEEIDSIIKANYPMVFMGSVRHPRLKWDFKNATIIEIRRHPDYKNEQHLIWCNIALVKLKEPYKMSKTIRTMGLATTFGLCQYCIIIGVGYPSIKANAPGITKYAKALIKEYKDLSYQKSHLTNTTFFTESEKGDVSSGYALDGDVGGPVICEFDGGKSKILIGVISGYYYNEQEPTVVNVIERVDTYIDFIKEHVPEVWLGRISTVSHATCKDIKLFPLLLAIAFCICTV